MLRLGDIDLTNLDNFTCGPPHVMLSLLRREAPVYFHPERNGPGFWAVMRHADVLAVSKDAETFSSERRGTMIFDEPDFLDRPAMLTQMDGERHSRYRNLVSRGFTPRMVERLEPFLRSLVAKILDRALELETCDFVQTVAGELPLQVITELLGVPSEDRPKVFDWANRIIAFNDPEFGGTGGRQQEPIAELAAYSRALARQKRTDLRDDIVSALLEADVGGNALCDAEFDLFFLLLAVAGTETTRSVISSTVLAFNEHPSEWFRLRGDPTLMPTAIEEVLRWSSPFYHFRRTATRDTELGGQEIRAGDKVVVWYPSANRDESVFAEPFRFYVGRDPNEHVSFGMGRHFCLGAHLARLELASLAEGLLDRDVIVEPVGPVEYIRSNFIHSIKRMPVRIRRRP
jgi:cholest-4-en-3-one 26-monooxygenase